MQIWVSQRASGLLIEEHLADGEFLKLPSIELLIKLISCHVCSAVFTMAMITTMPNPIKLFSFFIYYSKPHFLRIFMGILLIFLSLDIDITKINVFAVLCGHNLFSL